MHYTNHLLLVIVYFSDRTVQPQMDRAHFRKVNNLDLVKLNRIRDSICPRVRSLFTEFLMLKMLHMCTYHTAAEDIHPTVAVTSITSFTC